MAPLEPTRDRPRAGLAVCVGVGLVAAALILSGAGLLFQAGRAATTGSAAQPAVASAIRSSVGQGPGASSAQPWPGTAATQPPSPGAPPGAVAYTILPMNDTVAAGVHQPADGGFLLSGMAVDPTDHRLFVGDAETGVINVVDTTNGTGVAELPTPERTFSIALDTHNDEIWSAGAPWNVTAINSSTLRVAVPNVRVPNGPDAIVYDSLDDRLFVSSQYNDTLVEIDPDTGKLVGSTLLLPFSPAALCYDPQSDLVLVSGFDGSVRELNASSDSLSPISWHVGGFPDALALDPLHHWLYVANYDSGNVTALNLSSGQVVDGGIPVGREPVSMAFYGQDRSILVANAGSPNVTEISTLNNSAIRPSVSLVCCAGDLAVDPSTGRVFAVEYSPGGYLVNYLAVLEPVSSRALVGSIQLAFAFAGSVYDPNTNQIFVVNPTGQNGTGNPAANPPSVLGNSSVMVIDATTHRFLPRTYAVGYGASAIAFDPVDGDLYVANEQGGSISVLSPGVGVISTVTVGASSEPDAIAVDPVRNLVYVAEYNASAVAVLNGTTDRLAGAPIPVGQGPDAVGIDTDHHRLFVANCASDSVSVINSTVLLGIGSIPVGRCPSAVLANPASGRLFVANFYSPTDGYSNVTILNLSTLSGLGSVGTAFGSNALQLDPANGYLYVSNAGSSNLTVLNISTLQQVTPGISVAAWPNQSYPASLAYDAATAEMIVPTVYASAVYVVGDVITAARASLARNGSEVGVPLTLDVAVTGGTPPFSAVYSGVPPGCGSSPDLSLVCIPTASGTYSVNITVEDARGYSFPTHLDVTVAPPLEVVSVVQTPSPTEVGVATSLSVLVTGGVGPLSFAWNELPSGCSGANASAITCTPAQAGRFDVSANVTDALGARAFGALGLSVGSGPFVTLTALPSKSPFVGSALTLFASVIGGVAPVTFAYSGLPPGCASVDSAVVSCAPESPGSYRVTVEATDSLLRSAVAAANLTVALPPLTANITAEVASATCRGLSVDNFVLLSGSASGGVLPYTFAWTLPTGSATGSLTSTTTVYPGDGTPTENSVSLTVTDGSGTQTTTNLNVPMDLPPCPPPSSPNPPPTSPPWLAVTALVVASSVGVAAFVSVLRRRPPLGPNPLGTP